MTGELVVKALQQELHDRKVEQYFWDALHKEWRDSGTSSTFVENMLKHRWMWKQYLKFQQMRGNSPH